MKIKGAQIIIETLVEQGVDTVFGYPGGQVLNIYDELYNNSDRIRHIITAHEQGAAHAADGYARATGKVGVCIATSGPGATNLVTGIANAYLDSVPMVAITGNVPVDLLGRDSFQEVDIVGITMPVTKHNFLVKDVSKLAEVIREAFLIAKSGRPGPVLVDIPKNVQTDTAEFVPEKPVSPACLPAISEKQLQKISELIEKSSKPFIYFGGGATAAGAGNEIMKLAERIGAYTGCSMMGLSAIPSDFPRHLGMCGMHGYYSSTKAKNEADLIIAVGVRFSDRATGNKNKYAPGASIVHIEIDPAEIGKNIGTYLGVVADLKSTLEKLIEVVPPKENKEWAETVEGFRAKEKAHMNLPSGSLSPFQIIDSVCEKAGSGTPVVTDVGQHQMWTAQRFRFTKPRTFISSGGLGTMGFGMGAAIGASIASGKQTVLFTGDGSFGMNLNELATAVSNKIPLIILIFNNGVLGMVRQWQTLFFEKRYSHTTLERKTDFVRLAEAFGAKGFRAATKEEFDKCIAKAFLSDEPVVVDCMIDSNAQVLPMIPPGGSTNDLILK